jgi:hypothetical protein
MSKRRLIQQRVYKEGEARNHASRKRGCFETNAKGDSPIQKAYMHGELGCTLTWLSENVETMGKTIEWWSGHPDVCQEAFRVQYAVLTLDPRCGPHREQGSGEIKRA